MGSNTGTIVELNFVLQRRQFLEEVQRQTLEERRVIRKAKIKAEKKARMKSKKRRTTVVTLVGASFYLAWGVLFFSL